MNIVLRIAATAAAIWVAVWLVPGLEFDGGVLSFLAVTILVILANAIVKPIVNLFSLPIIVITLGLFLLVTNALILQLVVWLSGDVFELGFSSTGFFWATFLGALVISIVRTVLEKVLD